MNIQKISEEIESLEVYRKFVDVTRSIAQVKELRVKGLISRRSAYWSALQEAAFDTFDALRTCPPSETELTQSKHRCDPQGRWESSLTPSDSVQSLLTDSAAGATGLQRCLPSAIPAGSGTSVLMLVIGSSQGMCGDFHRKLIARLEEGSPATGGQTPRVVACLGTRTRNSIARLRMPSTTLIRHPVPDCGIVDELSGLDIYLEERSGAGRTPTDDELRKAREMSGRARRLARFLLGTYLKGHLDLQDGDAGAIPVNSICLMYNRVDDKSAVRSADTQVEQILPLTLTPPSSSLRDPFGRTLAAEPSLPLGAAILLPAYIESCLEQALMLSSRAEHAIRRQETTEASHSLEEMIDQKTLEKRKARREKITKQLVELISASEAYEQR